MDSNIVLSTQEYNVVGTRPIRHDGTDKVTGRAQYGDDVHLPGLLYGKILRSPYSHARIKSIDGTRALAHPEVRAVVTSADLPQPLGLAEDLTEGAMQNPLFTSNNTLATDKALYKGHAIAAVAATSSHAAEEALSLIDVEYEVLPPVMDAVEAMKDDAPILHERLATIASFTTRAGGLRREDDQGKSSNLANRFTVEIGDPEQGFNDSDLVVEREFKTEAVHQGYIEPHSATAHWGADGRVTIWCSSQGHFGARDTVASILAIPVSSIRVIPMEIGGGFGGKLTYYLEPVAAVLSRKTGRPVKLTMSRTEVFEGTGPTSGGYIKVKVGVAKDGRITAADTQLLYDAGAFPGSPASGGAACVYGSYDIPNARVEGLDVVTNRPKVAAYRAPGVPAATFGFEQVLDEICQKLEMDPLEFRLLNASKEGDRQVTGPRFGKIGCVETVQAAKDHDHYSTALEGPNRGRGIAGGFWRNNTGASSATAAVNADGTVSLVEGSADIGGSRAAAAQQCAEVLGISAEDVHPMVGDTDSIGYTSNTGGSGVAFKTGWACYEAAQDVRRQMIDRAATIWDVSTDDVDYADGAIFHKSDSELRFSFKELARRLNGTGGPITGRANVEPGGVGGAFAVHIVDVEVDPDTGKVDILRYTAVQDVGKAVHPSYVEGQIQGGVSQGVGWALNEEYFYNDKGEMANSSFLDYRMPTSLDLPMIDTVIVEVANPGHPYGVRGVGECPIVPPMAAVANAIHNAVGVRMTTLPMSPGNILRGLWEKQAQ